MRGSRPRAAGDERRRLGPDRTAPRRVVRATAHALRRRGDAPAGRPLPSPLHDRLTPRLRAASPSREARARQRHPARSAWADGAPARRHQAGPRAGSRRKRAHTTGTRGTPRDVGAGTVEGDTWACRHCVSLRSSAETFSRCSPDVVAHSGGDYTGLRVAPPDICGTEASERVLLLALHHPSETASTVFRPCVLS